MKLIFSISIIITVLTLKNNGSLEKRMLFLSDSVVTPKIILVTIGYEHSRTLSMILDSSHYGKVKKILEENNLSVNDLYDTLSEKYNAVFHLSPKLLYLISLQTADTTFKINSQNCDWKPLHKDSKRNINYYLYDPDILYYAFINSNVLYKASQEHQTFPFKPDPNTYVRVAIPVCYK